MSAILNFVLDFFNHAEVRAQDERNERRQSGSWARRISFTPNPSNPCEEEEPPPPPPPPRAPTPPPRPQPPCECTEEAYEEEDDDDEACNGGAGTRHSMVTKRLICAFHGAKHGLKEGALTGVFVGGALGIMRYLDTVYINPKEGGDKGDEKRGSQDQSAPTETRESRSNEDAGSEGGGGGGGGGGRGSEGGHDSRSRWSTINDNIIFVTACDSAIAMGVLCSMFCAGKALIFSELLKHWEAKAQGQSNQKTKWFLRSYYLQPVLETEDMKERPEDIPYFRRKATHLIQAAKHGMQEGVLTGMFLGGIWGICRYMVENGDVPSDHFPDDESNTDEKKKQGKEVRQGEHKKTTGSHSAKDNSSKLPVPESRRYSQNKRSSVRDDGSDGKKVQNNKEFRNVESVLRENVLGKSFRKESGKVEILGYAFVQTNESYSNKSVNSNNSKKTDSFDSYEREKKNGEKDRANMTIQSDDMTQQSEEFIQQQSMSGPEPGNSNQSIVTIGSNGQRRSFVVENSSVNSPGQGTSSSRSIEELAEASVIPFGESADPYQRPLTEKEFEAATKDGEPSLPPRGNEPRKSILKNIPVPSPPPPPPETGGKSWKRNKFGRKDKSIDETSVGRGSTGKSPKAKISAKNNAKRTSRPSVRKSKTSVSSSIVDIDIIPSSSDISRTILVDISQISNGFYSDTYLDSPKKALTNDVTEPAVFADDNYTGLVFSEVPLFEGEHSNSVLENAEMSRSDISEIGTKRDRQVAEREENVQSAGGQAPRTPESELASAQQSRAGERDTERPTEGVARVSSFKDGQSEGGALADAQTTKLSMDKIEQTGSYKDTKSVDSYPRVREAKPHGKSVSISVPKNDEEMEKYKKFRSIDTEESVYVTDSTIRNVSLADSEQTNSYKPYTSIDTDDSSLYQRTSTIKNVSRSSKVIETDEGYSASIETEDSMSRKNSVIKHVSRAEPEADRKRYYSDVGSIDSEEIQLRSDALAASDTMVVEQKAVSGIPETANKLDAADQNRYKDVDSVTADSSAYQAQQRHVNSASAAQKKYLRDEGSIEAITKALSTKTSIESRRQSKVLDQESYKEVESIGSDSSAYKSKIAAAKSRSQQIRADQKSGGSEGSMTQTKGFFKSLTRLGRTDQKVSHKDSAVVEPEVTPYTAISETAATSSKVEEKDLYKEAVSRSNKAEEKDLYKEAVSRSFKVEEKDLYKEAVSRSNKVEEKDLYREATSGPIKVEEKGLNVEATARPTKVEEKGLNVEATGIPTKVEEKVLNKEAAGRPYKVENKDSYKEVTGKPIKKEEKGLNKEVANRPYKVEDKDSYKEVTGKPIKKEEKGMNKEVANRPYKVEDKDLYKEVTGKPTKVEEKGINKEAVSRPSKVEGKELNKEAASRTNKAEEVASIEPERYKATAEAASKPIKVEERGSVESDTSSSRKKFSIKDFNKPSRPDKESHKATQETEARPYKTKVDAVSKADQKESYRKAESIEAEAQIAHQSKIEPSAKTVSKFERKPSQTASIEADSISHHSRSTKSLSRPSKKTVDQYPDARSIEAEGSLHRSASSVNQPMKSKRRVFAKDNRSADAEALIKQTKSPMQETDRSEPLEKTASVFLQNVMPSSGDHSRSSLHKAIGHTGHEIGPVYSTGSKVPAKPGGFNFLSGVNENIIVLTACNCALVLGVLCSVITTTRASFSL